MHFEYKHLYYLQGNKFKSNQNEIVHSWRLHLPKTAEEETFPLSSNGKTTHLSSDVMSVNTKNSYARNEMTSAFSPDNKSSLLSTSSSLETGNESTSTASNVSLGTKITQEEEEKRLILAYTYCKEKSSLIVKTTYFKVWYHLKEIFRASRLLYRRSLFRKCVRCWKLFATLQLEEK